MRTQTNFPPSYSLNHSSFIVTYIVRGCSNLYYNPQATFEQSKMRFVKSLKTDAGQPEKHARTWIRILLHASAATTILQVQIDDHKKKLS